MSFDCSWITYHAVNKSEILRIAGLRDTGLVAEVPEEPVNLAVLPTGWTVVYWNDSTYTLKHIDALTSNHAALSVIIQSYVPLSIAEFHVRSKQYWSVAHYGNKGRDNLEIEGKPPPELSGIRASNGLKQGGEGTANIDYTFEVPIELAATVCGFRHDRWKFDWGQPKWTVAVPT